MPTFDVYVSAIVTQRIRVNVETKEEAEEKGEVESCFILCHECSQNLEIGDPIPEHTEAVEVNDD